MFRAFHLLLLVVISDFFPYAQFNLNSEFPAQTTVTSGISRACTVNPVLERDSKAKPQKKLKHPVAPEPLPACLELKGEPIEVQEFLPSVVREIPLARARPPRAPGRSCAI
jgi:hypothetical protein